MKILLVEDEELFADQVEMLLDKMGHDLIDICDNSTHAVNVLNQHTIDLILMDIHIRGDLDGIELASLIKEKWNIPTIFITSLKDDLTFNRANRVGATNFIIKPFDQLQLQRAIELATHDINNTTVSDSIDENSIFFKKQGKLIKIALDDILYMEADGQYTQIHTSSERFIFRKPLSELADELSSIDFVQTHRSFMVRKDKITSVNLKDQTVHIEDTSIPISKRKKSEVVTSLGKIVE